MQDAHDRTLASPEPSPHPHWHWHMPRNGPLSPAQQKRNPDLLLLGLRTGRDHTPRPLAEAS
ncbi:hypothetical protein [Streptomyces sp. NPDC001657]|uniref:hypothetical protein n=1 Tax=Streptomyces sp. NPDC001657 TaxID=3154522 RepID=UPI00332614F2